MNNQQTTLHGARSNSLKTSMERMSALQIRQRYVNATCCALGGLWSLLSRNNNRDAADNSRCYAGQSTTEYAILVGVLVVIAMVAIVAFKGKVQELWQAIADGINAL